MGSEMPLDALTQRALTWQRYRNPPALDAPDREWRRWVVYQLGNLRRHQDAVSGSLRRLAADLEASRTLDQEKTAALHARLQHERERIDNIADRLAALEPVQPADEEESAAVLAASGGVT